MKKADIVAAAAELGVDLDIKLTKDKLLAAWDAHFNQESISEELIAEENQKSLLQGKQKSQFRRTKSLWQRTLLKNQLQKKPSKSLWQEEATEEPIAEETVEEPVAEEANEEPIEEPLSDSNNLSEEDLSQKLFLFQWTKNLLQKLLKLLSPIN